MKTLYAAGLIMCFALGLGAATVWKVGAGVPRAFILTDVSLYVADHASNDRGAALRLTRTADTYRKAIWTDTIQPVGAELALEQCTRRGVADYEGTRTFEFPLYDSDKCVLPPGKYRVQACWTPADPIKFRPLCAQSNVFTVMPPASSFPL